jgi:glycosyltransferase involved in cell wall biosynthesis
VVIPAYNEEKTIGKLHKRIIQTLKSVPLEVIIVDDGSSDGTWRKICKLYPVKGISLQRNYGQTPALDVGINAARGDIIVLMDADMQNDPSEIPSFLQKIGEGYDAVVGWRKERKDPLLRRLVSFFGNILARFFLKLRLHDWGCGLKVYRSKFIKDFRLWGEAEVFLPAVAKDRGAKIYEMPIRHYAREVGSSKIKIWNLLKGTFDLISIAFFIRYFSRPLRFFGGFGAAFIILGTIFSILFLLSGVVGALNETLLLMFSILFIVTGIILFMMGLLAEILLRIFYETKRASPFIIREIRENERN